METYSEKTDLKILTRKLKWRVYGLLAIYGLIIVASFVLFVFVLRYSTLTFLDIMHSGTVDKPEIGFILLLIAITAAILICVGTALAPLVNVLAHKSEEGIEIKREDYPDFFSLIDNIVKEVGCKSPKHVYISNDCNAGVFYNGIWGYCFQRLNLAIGIPLLFGMNKTELKAILSHEFGHFAQKSISTRRIAFISECLFGGFVTMADLDKKKADDTGITERLFARLSMKIMLRQYSEVDPLMAVLSRAQEYDADKYAYDVVGTDGFLSALTKTAEQSARWNDRFIPWLVDRIDEKRVPNDIFATFSNFSAKIDSFVGDSFTPNTHMTRPLGEYEFRVTRIDDQESHPSLFKRCNAISSLPVKNTEWDDTPAFDFFPKQVIDDIFNSIATKLKDQRYPDTTVFLKKEDFQGINIISMHDIVNPSLNLFYSDSVFYEDDLFNLDVYNTEDVAFPFTLENISRIRSYLVALTDLRRLNYATDENSPVKEFCYNGDIYYGRTKTPFEEHKAYFEPLYEDARKVASDCNKWILNQVKDHKDLLDMFFSMILCKITERVLDNLDIKMDVAEEPIDSIHEIEGQLEIVVAYLFETTPSGTPYIDFINPSFMASDLAMKDKMWNFLEDGCEDKNDLYSISSYILDLVKKHFSFSWDIIKYELIFPAIEANNKASL